MSEHEQRDLAEAYALSALDETEKKTFEDHLASCRECRQAVRAIVPAAAALGFTAESVKPPEGSGDRLVALYRQEKASAGPAASRSASAAVLFGLVALGLVGWGMYEHDHAEKLEERLEQCHDERAILDQGTQLSLVSPASRGFKGNAKIVYLPAKGVAILGNELPDPGPGKCYKLWSIAGTTVLPMRSFDRGVVFDRSPGGESTKFAISIEDVPGNVKRGTDVVLVPQGT